MGALVGTSFSATGSADPEGQCEIVSTSCTQKRGTTTVTAVVQAKGKCLFELTKKGSGQVLGSQLVNSTGESSTTEITFTFQGGGDAILTAYKLQGNKRVQQAQTAVC